MRKIYLLEDFEFKQLQKGRTIDIGEGVAIALSPEVSTNSSEQKAVLGKKRMTRDQKHRMRKAIFKAKDGSWSCRRCKEKGFKGRAGGAMHYMRNHVKGWRGEE